MHLAKNASIYFMGIGGTGMAGVAGLAKAAGYQVTGSDANLYPPMSTMLENLGIAVSTPYDAANLTQKNLDLIIVANALSKGHPELEKALELDIPYTSFPAFLGDYFLKDRTSIVVTGTHGKTTTTSLLAFLLEHLGESPSFLVGGIPKNFPYSFQLGKGTCFVIEGDEYDTAYFDKHSKFLHYQADFVILNNLEFDHADIFPDLEAIKREFKALLSKLSRAENIIANFDEPEVVNLLEELGLTGRVRKVKTLHAEENAYASLVSCKPNGTACEISLQPIWEVKLKTQLWGELTVATTLAGQHNAANITQVVACLQALVERGEVSKPTNQRLMGAFRNFKGVARRLEHLGRKNQIDIFEDFAHHPTAVEQVIRGIKNAYPNRRLLVAFEPKNATSRRNIFTERYAKALDLADLSFLGACPDDKRVEDTEKMNTKTLANMIENKKAKAFDDNQGLLRELVRQSLPGDIVVFMSSGSFSGIQHQILQELS